MDPDRVAEHYGRGGLADRILEALEQAGLADDLSPADLAAVDEFHVRGREATVELAHPRPAPSLPRASPRLRPTGRLAVYDVTAAPGGEVVLPAPWAERPEISFLVRPSADRP